MEKVGPNSKFFGHSTEIIQQSKIKGPLSEQAPTKKFSILLAFIRHFIPQNKKKQTRRTLIPI